jgi:phage baseplate assembly protein W
MNYSPVFPLKRDNIDGYQMQTDIQQTIKFHLKNLLLTSPGERISNPRYGVGLKKYLFEPLTQGSISIIEDAIEEQINSYLSYFVPSLGIRDSAEIKISGFVATQTNIIF